MKLNNLQKIDRKRGKRGRGSASGGKFFGRGTKGQNSRTGSGHKPTGFEGGQTPLKMRLPKGKGFRPYKRIEFETVNLHEITSKLAKKSTIDKKTLFEANLIRSADSKIKILGDGEIKKKIELKVDAVSASARKKIEKIGGKIVLAGKIIEKTQKPVKVSSKKNLKDK